MAFVWGGGCTEEVDKTGQISNNNQPRNHHLEIDISKKKVMSE